MDETTLRIEAGQEQTILVGSGLTRELHEIIASHLGGADRVIVVADSNALRFNPILGEALRGNGVHMVPVEAGEHVKSREWLLQLIDLLHGLGATRRSLLLAVGGGSLLDAAGFAASIYMRGMLHATMPSTLLSMADAGIGGKNGVNYAGRKNLLGCIRLPRLTIVDPLLLRGLPGESYREGFSEIVKHALLDSRERLEWLLARRWGFLKRNPVTLEEILSWSIRFKVRIVEADPFEEKGLRAILNLGHTIAHAIEAATHSSVTHGAAVAVGLYMEALLSRDLGIAGERVPDTVKEVLEALGLNTRTPVPPSLLAAYIGSDKKRRGDKILMPLLEEPGRVRLEWIPLEELREWLENLS